MATSKRQRQITAKRRALHERFEEAAPLRMSTPSGGWIRTLRESLGMTAKQLAKRIGLDESTVLRLEANEVKGTITLNSLRRLSAALEGELNYSILPKRNIYKILGDRAEAVINREDKKVARSMDLENQGGTRSSSRRRAILKELMIDRGDSKLWDED